VVVSRTATLFFDINSPYVSPGVDYDQLSIEGGTLTLNGPTLELRGARELRQSIRGITLVTATSRVIGEFGPGGSILVDGGITKVSVGSFRGNLIINGGSSGNDIVIGELALMPPIQLAGTRLPPP